MKNAISRKAPGYLLSAAIAASTAAIAMPVQAYNLYAEEGAELNLDIEAIFGIFSSEENYQGKAGDGSDWREGYIKAGFSGSKQYGDQRAAVYGALSAITSASYGDGDAAGFTAGDERRTAFEDAYVGWRSGSLFPVLGENGLDISVGSQNISLGDGFLINGDSLNTGDGILGEDSDRGGAYWLAPRKAFDKTFWAKVGGDSGLRSDLFWFESDNNAQGNVEMAGVNIEYVAEAGTVGVMYLKGLDQDDTLGLGYDRDGQETLSVRFQGNAGVENLFLSAEFADQESGSGTDAEAWYAEAGWTFADLPWSPSVNYRFTDYDENFDSLFYGFSRGYGTWFQGEVAANYAGPFGSQAEIHHVAVKAYPSETLALGALYFEFDETANANGSEFNLYAEWVAHDHLIISPLIGVYSPDSDNTAQNNTSDSTYFQLLAIVPF